MPVNWLVSAQYRSETSLDFVSDRPLERRMVAGRGGDALGIPSVREATRLVRFNTGGCSVLVSQSILARHLSPFRSRIASPAQICLVESNARLD